MGIPAHRASVSASLSPSLVIHPVWLEVVHIHKVKYSSRDAEEFSEHLFVTAKYWKPNVLPNG